MVVLRGRFGIASQRLVQLAVTICIYPQDNQSIVIDALSNTVAGSRICRSTFLSQTQDDSFTSRIQGNARRIHSVEFHDTGVDVVPLGRCEPGKFIGYRTSYGVGGVLLYRMTRWLLEYSTQSLQNRRKSIRNIDRRSQRRSIFDRVSECLDRKRILAPMGTHHPYLDKRTRHYVAIQRLLHDGPLFLSRIFQQLQPFDGSLLSQQGYDAVRGIANIDGGRCRGIGVCH